MKVTKKNEKQNYHMIQQFHHWLHTQRKSVSQRYICPAMLFTAARHKADGIWEQSKCPLMRAEVKKMVHICSRRHSTMIRRKLHHCNKMDEYQGHCAK